MPRVVIEVLGDRDIPQHVALSVYADGSGDAYYLSFVPYIDSSKNRKAGDIFALNGDREHKSNYILRSVCKLEKDQPNYKEKASYFITPQADKILWPQTIAKCDVGGIDAEKVKEKVEAIVNSDNPPEFCLEAAVCCFERFRLSNCTGMVIRALKAGNYDNHYNHFKLTWIYLLFLLKTNVFDVVNHTLLIIPPGYLWFAEEVYAVTGISATICTFIYLYLKSSLYHRRILRAHHLGVASYCVGLYIPSIVGFYVAPSKWRNTALYSVIMYVAGLLFAELLAFVSGIAHRLFACHDILVDPASFVKVCEDINLQNALEKLNNSRSSCYTAQHKLQYIQYAANSLAPPLLGFFGYIIIRDTNSPHHRIPYLLSMFIGLLMAYATKFAYTRFLSLPKKVEMKDSKYELEGLFAKLCNQSLDCATNSPWYYFVTGLSCYFGLRLASYFRFHDGRLVPDAAIGVAGAVISYVVAATLFKGARKAWERRFFCKTRLEKRKSRDIHVNKFAQGIFRIAEDGYYDSEPPHAGNNRSTIRGDRGDGLSMEDSGRGVGTPDNNAEATGAIELQLQNNNSRDMSEPLLSSAV